MSSRPNTTLAPATGGYFSFWDSPRTEDILAGGAKLAEGVATIAAAFLIEDVLLSAIHGVLGASSLWSIGELFEQKQRCEKGWFPKNPKRIGKGYYKDEVKDEERK